MRAIIGGFGVCSLVAVMAVACGRGPMALGVIDQPGGDAAHPSDSVPGAETDDVESVADAPTNDGSPDLRADMAKARCGNGRYDRGEECDDGNDQSGDGCSGTCKLECGDAGVEPCIDPGFFPDNPWYLCCVPRQLVVCGDGQRQASEACDDSNITDGDGCSSICQIEPGHRCPAPGRACAPICGDGVSKGAETCDDGNRDEGDGCSRFCLTEPGWACSAGACARLGGVDGGPGPVLLYCGDGVVSGAEECDRGADNDDDTYGGCSTQCAYVCCGDGMVNGPEECDLAERNGTSSGRGGCTMGCTKTDFCGNGIVDTQLGEECDLGENNGRPLDPRGDPSDGGFESVLCRNDCTIHVY